MMKYLALALSILTGFISVLFFSGNLLSLSGLDGDTPIPIVLEGTDAFADAKWELIGRDISGPIWLIIAFSLFSICYSWYRRLCRKKPDAAKEDVSEPFVLYLRSFVDDQLTSKTVGGSRSEEEHLVDVLSDIAPVYAIGNPEDKTMPLGAQRIYVDASHWKDVVHDLMKRAVLVALRLGETDSFLWEVETALKTLPLDNVLFVVPESKTFSKVATLYKTLLEHGIDIKHLDVSVEAKKRGSISSFLYFDSDGQPQTREVKNHKFSKFLISYDNLLRSALSDFRTKYGLRTSSAARKIRFSRIALLLTLFAVVFATAAKVFSDQVSLKYQMPYELVQNCVKDQAFVNAYSDKVNGTNLTYSVIEARRGLIALPDEEFMEIMCIEMATQDRMSDRELCLMDAAAKNLLLMVKKYQPEHYARYVELLSKACLMAVNNPQEIQGLISQYQSLVDGLPDWVRTIYDENVDQLEMDALVRTFNQAVEKHVKDPDIALTMKILICNGMTH